MLQNSDHLSARRPAGRAEVFKKKGRRREERPPERQTESSPPHASISHQGPPAIFLWRIMLTCQSCKSESDSRRSRGASLRCARRFIRGAPRRRAEWSGRGISSKEKRQRKEISVSYSERKEVKACIYPNSSRVLAWTLQSCRQTFSRSHLFRFITALVYLNYRLMMNGAARGYVHRGTAFLQKKLFSVVRGSNCKGVRWFIDAVMQIKAARGSRTRLASTQMSSRKRPHPLNSAARKSERVSLTLDFGDWTFCKWFPGIINHRGDSVANDGGGSRLAP